MKWKKSNSANQSDLIGIVSISILLPVIGSLIAITVFKDWTFVHEPIHTLFEGIGVAFAFFVLIIIYFNYKFFQLQRKEAAWITSALLTMSLLDLLHASVHLSNLFVWFHSIAQLSGGVLFACIWLPFKWNSRRYLLVLTTFSVALTLGFYSLKFPEHLPVMMIDGKFSGLARALNIIGGAGFLIAGWYFFKKYQTYLSKNNYLLAAHCFLFGSANILFEVSTLWDAAWWWWHILRFCAYSVLLQFFFSSIQQFNINLTQSNLLLEKKVAERTARLEQSKQELLRSNQDLELFAGRVSHDLRSPIRNVSSLLSMLLLEIQGVKLTDDARKYIDWLNQSSLLMQKQIDDLLAYSLASNHELSWQLVNTNKLIERVVSSLNPEGIGKQMDVTIEKLPSVFADSMQLGLVLQNLIENAIKYQPHGQLAKIHISGHTSENEAVIAVADNGIGVKPKHHESIFKLFKRLHSQQVYPGTGLGLGLSKKIIERHGGRLWIESDPAIQPGSIFKFTLPLTR